jgi:CheY-like chemotaxis protein
VHYKEAYNGLEAVNLFKTNQFDLLLIDLEMPEMDGYAAIEEIRKMDAKIPAIAFTAAMLENMEQHLLSKGFSGYCSKPFKPSDLHSKLKAVYAMKPTEKSNAYTQK